MQTAKPQLTIFKEQEQPLKRKYTKRIKGEPTIFEIGHMSMEQLTGRKEIIKPVLNEVESGQIKKEVDTSMKRCIWFKKKK